MNKQNGTTNNGTNGKANRPENELWNLSPAPEGTDHVKLDATYDLFINGKFIKSTKGKRFKTINPAPEEPTAAITDGTTPDANRADQPARTA